MNGITPEDLDTLARTLWGEARGEGWPGQLAVAWVARNRAERGGWWGDGIAAVCRRPWQFSCWNAGDANSARLGGLDAAGSDSFRQCLAAAAAVLLDLAPDPTDGATHYLATRAFAPHTAVPRPGWAAGARRTAVIGGHEFFRDVR